MTFIKLIIRVYYAGVGLPDYLRRVWDDWSRWNMRGELIILWVSLAVLIIGGVVLFSWLGWYLWWINNHHCVLWSQPYWATDHYGMPVQTRDCVEWSH